MENLRPLLSVNLVPLISNLVLNLLYDIIELIKSKILPLRLQTAARQDGKKAKKNASLNLPCSRSRMENLRPLLSVNLVPVISNLV
jgi:hypothetical protein